MADAPGLDWTPFSEAVPEDGKDYVLVVKEGPGSDDAEMWMWEDMPTGDALDGLVWRYPPVSAVQREAIEREVMAKVARLLVDGTRLFGVTPKESVDRYSGWVDDVRRFLRAAGLPVPGEVDDG